MLQGKACAVMGTTGNGILPNLEASSHTTLDALQLQNALHAYAQAGAEPQLKRVRMVWSRVV